MVPPVSKSTAGGPATPVTVPPQVLVPPGGMTKAKPAGNVSETATPVKATELEFAIVKVRVVTPFSATAGTPNA